ncbi:MAG: tape measure protein [Deltaproteobacteria bacterium]
MATVIEEFVARLGWDVDDRDLRRFKKSVGGLKQTFSNVGRHVRNVLFGAGGLAYGFNRLMGSFRMFEDAEAAFTPMVGGAERAAMMVERLNQAAASTPYQFGALSDVATQLLTTMGGDIDQTIERMLMLGDTARGQTDKLRRITLGYNKALLKQRVDMESLNIILEAGVPILDELAAATGRSAKEIIKLVSQGKVKTTDLTEAFRRMTSEGGMFFKGMETASVTLSGRISTFWDNVSIAAAGLGKAFAPALKDVTIEVTEVSRSVARWAKANEGLIKSKFESFLKSVRGLMKDIRDFGRRVYQTVERMGGLTNVFKLLAIAVAAVKLAPFIVSLSSLIRLAPTAAAALGGLAASAAPLLGVGLAIGVIALAIDDIRTTLKGGDSLGFRLDEYLGISDAMQKLSKLQAEFLGFDFDKMMQSVVGITGGDWTEMFLTPLRTLGDLIHNYIVVPLYKVAFAVPDTLYKGR